MSKLQQTFGVPRNLTRYRLIPANGEDLYWTQDTGDDYYVSIIRRNKGTKTHFLRQDCSFAGKPSHRQRRHLEDL